MDRQVDRHTYRQTTEGVNLTACTVWWAGYVWLNTWHTQTGRQTGREVGRQVDRQVDRHIDRQLRE